MKRIRTSNGSAISPVPLPFLGVGILVGSSLVNSKALPGDSKLSMVDLTRSRRNEAVAAGKFNLD